MRPMTAARTAWLPPSRALTVADLDAMVTDDGHRYELIDGVLIVSPAPTYRHQMISVQLVSLMNALCPTGLRVYSAPCDVVLADDTMVQPDILVTTDVADRSVRPLLAIEILSPSTRMFDLVLKKERYQRAGIPSYWVIHPEGPRLVAWELRGGEFVEIADVTGDQEWSASAPFGVRIVPSELLKLPRER